MLVDAFFDSVFPEPDEVVAPDPLDPGPLDADPADPDAFDPAPDV